jgi:hypothetical protein
MSSTVYRAGAGFVQKSTSKRKARCRELRAAQRGPISPLADLRYRIARVPGLDHHADFLAWIFRSWLQLGSLSRRHYQAAVAALPQKRFDHPEDLWDHSRLGPGHLNSIDELRRQARAEAIEKYGDRKQAAKEFKELQAYVRPIALSRSSFRYVDSAI